MPATRRLLVFVETKRALGADEEPYSRTVTIPDDAIAPVSAKNSSLLRHLQVDLDVRRRAIVRHA